MLTLLSMRLYLCVNRTTTNTNVLLANLMYFTLNQKRQPQGDARGQVSGSFIHLSHCSSSSEDNMYDVSWQVV